MTSFTDCKQRAWELQITMADVPWLKEAGLDLGAAVKDKEGLGLDPLGQALDDFDSFGRCLWVLCEDQAKERALTPEQFARGFDGAAMLAAQQALAEAVIRFTHPRHASKLTAALAGVMEQSTRTAGTVLDQILTGLNESAGSSQASPASTPGLTP